MKSFLSKLILSTIVGLTAVTLTYSIVKLVQPHVPELGYSIVAPEKEETPLPLLVALHGSGGNGEEFKASSNLGSLALERNFIAVFPSGVDGTWDGGNCCSSEHKKDVEAIKAIINNVKQEHNIDASRVFVAGFSNGGIMAYRIACELSDIVTGVASVSGTIGVEECQHENPVTVFHAHGTNDTIVPFNGGKGEADGDVIFTSVKETINRFTSKCDFENETTWSCDKGTAVHLAINNGSHGWFKNIEGELYNFLYTHPRVS